MVQQQPKRRSNHRIQTKIEQEKTLFRVQHFLVEGFHTSLVLRMIEVPFKKHYRIQVFGNVYRVGFRFLAMSKAYELKIAGFVRNEHDGSIYIEAEGSEKDLSLFVDWCQLGPPGSRVDDIKKEEGELVHFEGFDMR